ncbi:TIGR02678 family protein [Paenibacillus sp. YN15]|uniref:TIGR02678 family protein n=1 Tax=Paenibacillus sp. YN15 TaxID=1742774 RepID=UPI000DCE08A8|nr:TIGR02678 family protein [Paenibacillus sp. YN15]RAU92832.1 TIGR02678 family protein [Paenibacillus sp. YN15]
MNQLTKNRRSPVGRTGKSVDQAGVAERRKACAEALLNRPWILKETDSEIYHAIKDQHQELREWFMRFAGMSLVVTRTMAKLEKVPVTAHPWMGFGEFREKRDYVFFTYGLWFLEGKTELDQFLLTDLTEQVREHMLAEGMEADWTNYYHRLSMARALKRLKTLGALLNVDGDETDWAQDAGRNVLYECSPVSRYILRRFPQDLTAYDRPEQLADPVVYADTPDGIADKRRHRVYRRFLLEPVVLDRQWDEDDLYYVITQRRSLIDQLEKMLGWEGRRYREGLLFFHPELTGEPELFPTLSAISDLALLVAGELRRELNLPDSASGLYTEDDGSIRIRRLDLERLLLKLRERHKEYWSKEHREATSTELADQLFSHLAQWSLGEWADEANGIFVLYPVLGRWTAEYASREFDL